MVDINLIGDDKTGEEERVDDFTQTSSMDTQELAFEERTETFDTTKTAGFSQKRNYSSLIATLIIMAVIILLGTSIYFFMFSDDEAEQASIPDFPASSDEVVSTEPVDDPELRELEQQFAEDIQDFEQGESAEQPAGTSSEPVAAPEVSQPSQQPPARQPEPARTQQPAPTRTQPARSSTTPVNAGFVAASHEAVESVTTLLSQVPSDLSTTLLSYTGQRVRMELVAGSSTSARNFAQRLNQTWNGANFEVVSESQVEGNGAFLEKALISGRIAGASNSANGGVRFMTLAQAKDWLNQTARQFGLNVRELKTQPGTRDGGYQKTPVVARVYGNQSSLVGFLEEMSNQSVNLELVKILLVSPDMLNYTDDNLILVLNMLLYEQ